MMQHYRQWELLGSVILTDERNTAVLKPAKP
jgi:hypothetical protein